MKTELLLGIIENLLLLVILWKGTFINTRLFLYAKFVIGLLLLGLAFKILHYSGADLLIVVSGLGLLVPYSVHFLRKTPKIRLDYLKMATVVAISTWPSIVMLHLVPNEIRDAMRITISILIAVTFIDFLFALRKQESL